MTHERQPRPDRHPATPPPAPPRPPRPGHPPRRHRRRSPDRWLDWPGELRVQEADHETDEATALVRGTRLA